MDETQDREDRPQVAKEHLENAHLPGLIGRMLDDMVRIAETQTRLFEANIGSALTGALDRALGRALAGLIYLAGGVCLLAAIILLLHEWLSWWEALAIAGAVMILAGWVMQKLTGKMAASEPARRNH